MVDGLEVLFQPRQFYDSISALVFAYHLISCFLFFTLGSSSSPASSAAPSSCLCSQAEVQAPSYQCPCQWHAQRCCFAAAFMASGTKQELLERLTVTIVTVADLKRSV